MSNILHTTTSDFCQRSLARGDNVDKIIIICVGSGTEKRVLVNWDQTTFYSLKGGGGAIQEGGGGVSETPEEEAKSRWVITLRLT